MLELALITIFAIHLLVVDLAMAGPLVAMWLEWRATRRSDAAAGSIGRRLAWWSLGALAVGTALGLLALVALPHGGAQPYRAALGMVPASRWWYAAGEIVFSLVCLTAYAGLWNRLTRHRYWHRGLATLAATNLMYHFPPLFAIISKLSLRPDLWGRELDRPFYLQLLLDGEILSRTMHDWLSAVAVAAVMAIVLAKRAAPALAGGGETGPLVRQAARIGLVATLLQVPVGIWVLVALPESVQNQLLGESWLATGLFGLAVVAALGLMHHLAVVSLGEASARTVTRSAVLVVVVVCLMVATLHFARQRVYEQMNRAATRSRLNGPEEQVFWTGLTRFTGFDSTQSCKSC